MSDEILISLLLGSLIGGTYVLTAFLANRFAMGRSQRIFLLVTLGGIGVRLLLAAALVALVFALMEISQPAFLAGFFVLFTLGLILEVVYLHRSQKTLSGASTGNAAESGSAPSRSGH